MTALARVLSGRVAPGAYRWPTAYDAARAARVVDRVGWRHALLVGTDLADRADLVRALGRELDLSGLYADNLDALEERLRRQRGPTLVQWQDWGVLAASYPRVVRGALEILTGRPESPTWVLLRGTGPADDATGWELVGEL